MWLVHPVRRTFTTQGLRNGWSKSAWRSASTRATVVEGTTTTVRQAGWTGKFVATSTIVCGILCFTKDTTELLEVI